MKKVNDEFSTQKKKEKVLVEFTEIINQTFKKQALSQHVKTYKQRTQQKTLTKHFKANVTRKIIFRNFE